MGRGEIQLQDVVTCGTHILTAAARRSATREMRGNLAEMWAPAMLEEIDALPGAQCQCAVLHGDAERHRHHRGFDMGGHVIETFVGVGQIGHRRIGRWRDQAVEEIAQVGLHFGIGIFLNEQAGRRVTHKQREQAVPRPSDPVGQVAGEFIKTLSLCPDGEGGLHDAPLLIVWAA